MKNIKVLSITLYFVLLGCFLIPSTQASIAGDNILITEVMYDAPTSDATQEWFELYNPTDAAINITGWSAHDNYDYFNLTGVIPAKGFFVVAVDETGFFDLYGYNANQTGGWNSFALSNSGDRITLYDNNSVAVDYVAWEGGDGEWSSLSAVNTSIRRKTAIDTDTVSDWEDSATIGDPGFGDYVIIVPELPQTLIGVFILLTGLLTVVGLNYRKK